MTQTLLSTKLYFPMARASLVPRPRLIERLAEGLQGPLTLISAPAGSGKTTLLAEWRQGLGRATPAAWFAIDPADNDPTLFFQYLSAALEPICPGLASQIRSLLQASERPPLENVLTVLINLLSTREESFVLVLDDYHFIQNLAVDQALAFLLDHMPPCMHMVILTRADPAFPLSRLRARGLLTEIRAEHLRFTSTETAAFLNEVMRLHLPAQDVEALEARTEGWIAGLQLAGLSMQGHADVQAFISGFTGSHHYIVDYLVEEVLDHQPPPVRDFLLKTSILSRLSGPLCDLLTGRSDGQATLEMLAQANLFLAPLDDQRSWYRYHHLFGDMLANRLQGSDPTQLPDLHLRASRWFEEKGDTNAAIHHALAARHWERAATLMDSASQAAMRASETGKLMTWAKAIPEDVLLQYPTLSINCAWAFLLTGQPLQADTILNGVEARVRGDPDLWVDWLAVVAYLARGRGDMPRAITLAHQALAVPETRSIESQSILGLTLALTYWHMGKPLQAVPLAERAARQAKEAGNWQVFSTMLGLIGRIRAMQGRLHDALEIYCQVTGGGQPAPVPGIPEWSGSGIIQSSLAALYYEWNQIEQAAGMAALALKYSHLTGHGEIKMSSHRLMARIHWTRGELAEAAAQMNQSIETVHQHHLPPLMSDRAHAEAVQLALLQGDLARAEEAFQQIHGPFGAAFHYPHIPLENAMLSLARGQKAEAAEILVERYAAAEASQAGYAQVEIRILQALAAQDEATALDFISDALRQAQPEGYVRTFVDRGLSLGPVLRLAARRGVEPEYTARLLAAMSAPAAAAPTLPRPPALDILSKREIELLRLIAAGRSNKEIAGELYISIGTVKRHTVNIFTKLDVKNRTEAVAKARRLGQL